MEAAATGMLMMLYIAFLVFMIVTMWKIFEKAGRPGWAAIIPFYNLYVLLKIAGMSGWWLLGSFVPILSFVVAILMSLGIARNFGKSDAFAIGLIFLGFVFFPILAWGDAQYIGPPPEA
jgi:hypothetical protein